MWTYLYNYVYTLSLELGVFDRRGVWGDGEGEEVVTKVFTDMINSHTSLLVGPVSPTCVSLSSSSSSLSLSLLLSLSLSFSLSLSLRERDKRYRQAETEREINDREKERKIFGRSEEPKGMPDDVGLVVAVHIKEIKATIFISCPVCRPMFITSRCIGHHI